MIQMEGFSDWLIVKITRKFKLIIIHCIFYRITLRIKLLLLVFFNLMMGPMVFVGNYSTLVVIKIIIIMTIFQFIKKDFMFGINF
jgi:hypothetical protein